HHMFGGVSGLLDEPCKVRVGHIGLRLLMGLARAHRAVQVALSRSLDDVLDGQGAQSRPPREVSPQKLRPIPGPHRSILMRTPLNHQLVSGYSITDFRHESVEWGP